MMVAFRVASVSVVPAMLQLLPLLVLLLLPCMPPVQSASSLARDAALYKWDWTVVERTEANYNYSSTAVPWGTAAALVREKTSYYLKIRILNSADSSVCEVCAAELSTMGGYPEIETDVRQSALSTRSLNGTWIYNIKAGDVDWTVPFTTSSAGTAAMSVTLGAIVTPRLAIGGILPLVFSIRVSWIPAGVSDISVGSAIAAPISHAVFGASVSASIAHVPGLSAHWVSTVTSTGGSLVLQSTDKFSSISLLSFTVPSSVQADVDVCSGASSPSTLKIAGTIMLRNSTLLHVQGGIVMANVPYTSKTSVQWTNVLAKCIGRMAYPTQQPANIVSAWSPVVFIGSGTDAGRVWWLRGEAYTIAELLDASSRTMADAIFSSAAITILDASSPSTGTRAIVFLVQSASVYYLVTYRLSDTSWVLTFRFPSTVPASTEVSGQTPFQRLWNTDASVTDAFSGLLTVTSPEAVALTRLAFHASISSDFYVYGSALFYSPDAGKSMFLARSMASTPITSFVSSPSGPYAFGTSDNQIWTGLTGSRRLVPLSRSRSTPGTVYMLHYDDADDLYEQSLAVNVGASTGTLARSLLRYTDVVSFSEFASGKSCPVTGISYRYIQTGTILRSVKTRLSDLKDDTRPVIDTTLVTQSQPPSSIYLDMYNQYNFEIKLAAASPADLASLRLSFKLSDISAIQIRSHRVESVQDASVTYRILVTDLGLAGVQMAAVYTSPPTVLSITLESDSMDCSMDSSSLSTSIRIPVYSGCPLHTKLDFMSHTETLPEFECVDGSTAVPCVSFDAEFMPSLVIDDPIASTHLEYTDLHTLRIVGGGPTLDTVTAYTSSEMAAVNPGSGGSTTLVWMTASPWKLPDGSPLLSKSVGMRWVCNHGSPCENILPTLSQPSPSYYFLIEATTNPLDTSSPSNYTYCSFTSQRIIKLYAIPPSFKATGAAMATTTAFLLIVLAVWLGVQIRIERLEMGRVSPFEEQFKVGASQVGGYATHKMSAYMGGGAAAYTGGGGDGGYYSYGAYTPNGMSAEMNDDDGMGMGMGMGTGMGNLGTVGNMGGGGISLRKATISFGNNRSSLDPLEEEDEEEEDDRQQHQQQKQYHGSGSLKRHTTGPRRGSRDADDGDGGTDSDHDSLQNAHSRGREDDPSYDDDAGNVDAVNYNDDDYIDDDGNMNARGAKGWSNRSHSVKRNDGGDVEDRILSELMEEDEEPTGGLAGQSGGMYGSASSISKLRMHASMGKLTQRKGYRPDQYDDES
ncbi:hypothetical protein BC831DRAFT_464210 [Entophlyctis helioformis]|nr:hypothetical protein BC831DRAFT_464210 [Entophlyctis helioformis]